MTSVDFKRKLHTRRRTSFMLGPCVLSPPRAGPARTVTGLHKVLGHFWLRSQEQLDFGTPPPLALPLSGAPPPLPKVALAPRKSELRFPLVPGEAGREGRARKGTDSLVTVHKFSAHSAPPLRPSAGILGHAGALGPRGSMKGSDQVYTRGPALGWLFSKCCCCFPCRGEWLSLFVHCFGH